MLSDSAFEPIYLLAKLWTLEAGRRLREGIEDVLQIEYKTSAADIVTHKDREIEQFFVEKISKEFPDHYVLGEEGIASEESYNPQDEVVWIIDPIDGTTNFVHQKQNFSISVAVYEKGEPRIGIIYDPIQDECFHAYCGHGAYMNDRKLESLTGGSIEEAVLGMNSLWLTPNSKFDHMKLQSLARHVRGTRSVGSAALEMAYVACERLDGYLTLRLSPWDFAAGLVILSELGATMTTIHNQKIDVFSKSTVFVAKEALHKEIMERFIRPQIFQVSKDKEKGESKMRVGFIGLGTMGLPMVKNLLQAQFETWVVSRSRGPIEEAISLGAKEAQHPADLASKVDILLTCLPMPETIEQVYFGPNGIIHGGTEGIIVIDHSTVSPELNKRQEEAVRALGGRFMDGPLSGGQLGAKAGTLTIMCGGTEEVFEKSYPVLKAMGETIERIGPVGSGSVVKLINNLLVGIHTAALSEAFVIGAKAGIDPALIHKIIQVSTGHSFMIDRTIDLIQDRDFEQRFMVDLLYKDMKLATTLAEQLGVEAELGTLTEKIIGEVSRRGYGKQDVAAIIRRLEENSGVEVRRVKQE